MRAIHEGTNRMQPAAPRRLTRRAFSLAGLGLAALWPPRRAAAHGPSRQKVVITADIAAPPDKVWAIVQDFGSLAAWNPSVASSPADHGNEIGSKRVVTFKGEPVRTVTEELTKYNAEGRTYSTFVEHTDPKGFPANDYSSALEVQPADSGGGSTLELRAAFYRGYMLNDPPPELNDAASKKVVAAFLQAGVDGIKQRAEQG